MFSTMYWLMAVLSCLMSAIVLRCRDLSTAFSRLGMAIAAMMPMMATTISSSISVNPFERRFMPRASRSPSQPKNSSNHRGGGLVTDT